MFTHALYRRSAALGRRVQDCRRGLVTWATLLAVLLLCVLQALVFNVGATVNSKLRVQTAADAIASSDAVWMARGMNAITTSNHLMGELAALYVMHHALGADHLDEQRVQRMHLFGFIPLDPWVINLAYVVAQATPGIPIPVESPGPIANSVKASEESTLWQAKRILKVLTLIQYGKHAAGRGLSLSIWPPTVKKGINMQRSARTEVQNLKREYRFLDTVERFAVSVRDVKRKGIINLLKAIHGYSLATRTLTPLTARRSTAQLQDLYGVAATSSFGAILAPAAGTVLPVVRESKGSFERARDRRSQLIRATYPWVKNWRIGPSLMLWLGAPKSLAGWFYVQYPDQYSFDVPRQMRRRSGEPGYDHRRSLDLRLLVMARSNVPTVDKGQETWTEDTVEADRRFGVLAFAQQKSPPWISANAYFRQENPDGVITFAQGMLYNANPQLHDKHRRPSKYDQPRVGWDTLNWHPNKPKAIEYELAYSGFWGIFLPWEWFAQAPNVRVNWQAKLTPVSGRQLMRAVAWTAAEERSDRLRKVLVGRAGAANPVRNPLIHH